MGDLVNGLGDENVIRHCDVYVHSIVQFDGSLQTKLMTVSDVFIPTHSCRLWAHSHLIFYELYGSSGSTRQCGDIHRDFQKRKQNNIHDSFVYSAKKQRFDSEIDHFEHSLEFMSSSNREKGKSAQDVNDTSEQILEAANIVPRIESGELTDTSHHTSSSDITKVNAQQASSKCSK